MSEIINNDIELPADSIGKQSYMGCMINGMPAIICYDEVNDKATMVDSSHPLYAQAMAAFSLMEMAFVPQKPEKKTLLHVERPKLIKGMH